MSCNNHNPISAFIAGGGGGGGSVNTGVLQTLGGGALSGTLQTITDQSSNQSPLQLSSTQVGFTWAKARGTSSVGVIDIYGTTSQDLQFWTADGGTRYGYITAQLSGIEFLASTSRYLAFGAGNAEGMRLTSTRDLVIGTTAASARLQVRGDGTNPIARFESSTAGTYFTSIEDWTFGTRIRMNGFLMTENTSSMIYTTTNNGTGGVGDLPIHQFTAGQDLSIGSTSNLFTITRTISPPTGSANFRLSNVIYTINASGVQTGTATGIFLNATETNLNGMAHNLMDLQVGGVNRFIVNNAGAGTFAGNVTSGGGSFIFTNAGRIYAPADGIFQFMNNAFTSFTGIKLGGDTSGFPYIKRNNAEIDFRLADDTNYANVSGKGFISYEGSVSGFQIAASVAQSYTGLTIQSYNTTLGGKILTLYSTSVFEADATSGGGVTLRGSGDTHTAEASALFAMKSTTKGLLPPRMTQAQINAIPSPAEGLLAYNTDITHLCIFANGSWHKLNYSGM